MPELPEVETTRRGLEVVVVGRTIERIEVRQARQRWRVPDELASAAAGQHMRRLSRRAKYLLFSLPNGTFIVHLGMSGSLRALSATTPPLLHDHLDIVLDSGMCLRFNDPRRFGCVLWTTSDPEQH